jgi:hypothetical protein
MVTGGLPKILGGGGVNPPPPKSMYVRGVFLRNFPLEQFQNDKTNEEIFFLFALIDWG